MGFSGGSECESPTDTDRRVEYPESRNALKGRQTARQARESRAASTASQADLDRAAARETTAGLNPARHGVEAVETFAVGAHDRGP